MSQIENIKSPKAKALWWQTRRAQWTIFVSVGVGIVGLLSWWFLFHPYVSTDDARIAATLIRIAPESVGGRVIRLAVKEGDQVKKGDVLIELDHRIVQAHLQRAKAKAVLAERELRRVTELVAQRGLAPKELDSAKANADISQAELKLAEVAEENTTLKSPVDGVVIQKTTEEGNIVEPGQTLLTISDENHAWVAANIEETSIGLVKVGQPVNIVLDEGGSFSGKVSEVRASVASQFALIPSDSGAGNFTKVVQRVPIKVEIEQHRGFRAGQSVEIKIRVH